MTTCWSHPLWYTTGAAWILQVYACFQVIFIETSNTTQWSHVDDVSCITTQVLCEMSSTLLQAWVHVYTALADTNQFWSHLFCCGVMHCLSMEHEIFEKLLEFYIICSQIYAEACLWCEPGLNIHYEDWIYQAYNSTVYQDKSMNIHWRCHITL